MKKLRILLALLLVLTLSAQALPVSSDAAQTVAAQPAEETPNIQIQYTVCEKVFDAAPAADEELYHTSVADAAAVLREGMKQRQKEISLGYFFAGGYDQSVPMQIWDAAVTHTGVPTEGDYLRWHRGGCSISGSYYLDRQGNAYATLTYDVEDYTTQAQEARMDAAVDALLAELDLWDGTDYEKVVGVYNWMCQNITYDHANLENTGYMLKYSAYAALIDRTAVCQGYATLLYRLLLTLGVDNRVITGVGNGGGHAWNIVKLEGLYYDVDATWDASWWQDGWNYQYFLLPDRLFDDHCRDDEYATADFSQAYPMTDKAFIPPCDSHNYVDGVCTRCGREAQALVQAWNVPYVITGNTVTVEYGYVCKAGYWDAAAGKYVALTAVQNPDGSYRFDLPAEAKELLIVAVGDLSGDGVLDSRDLKLLAKLLLQEGGAPTAEQCFAADVNGNGKLNSADRTLLARALAAEDAPYYKALAWNTAA